MFDEQQSILIVDDKPRNLHALRKTLSEFEVNVVEANSGNEALIATLEHRFALAILDVQMPVMDGIELAEILQSDPNTQKLPVIFLTAALFEERHILSGYDTGAVDYIVKPYEPKILLAKVRVFLELDRQRIELQNHRENLELLVEKRTHELKTKQEDLKKEIERRIILEEELRIHRDSLEVLVEKRTASLKLRTEELKCTNEELDAFAAAVSHDLRAPLRFITGIGEATLKNNAKLLPDDVIDNLEGILKEATNMDVLINDVLQLSRAAKTELEYEKVDLGKLSREIISRLQKTDPERNVDASISENAYAKGDPRFLSQVLENLLGNAWKFTGRTDVGSIEFGKQDYGGTTTFFVKDNGAGFDMQYAEHLFTPFRRLHSKRAFPGTGVGLSTVQRIIHRHGGRIWFDSAVDQGTTFFFTLNETK